MSLLEQLPKIIANGRQQALRIRESLEGRHRIRLQSREYVTTAATAGTSAATVQQRRPPLPDDVSTTGWTNRLICGDNLLAMAALLAGNKDMPSLQGRIDLIHFAPPLGPPAAPRTRITMAAAERGKPPMVIKPPAYADTRPDDIASCLVAIVPRLALMRELLADTGSIHVPLGSHVSHYLKLVLDEIFGKDNFVQELIWTQGAIAHYAKASALRYANPINPLHGHAGNSTTDDESVLECIIWRDCPAGGTVADFYGGAGTTAAVAEKLGRRWITVDRDKSACSRMRQRLIGQKANPYLYQAVDCPVEPVTSYIEHDFFIGRLSERVLSSFGATPLPSEEDPVGNLGATVIDGKKTLVRVDSPDRSTGEASLQKTLAQLKGGWDRVVLLGWRFEQSLGATLAALRHPNLEVLEIQPVQTDALSPKAGFGKQKMRFSSLRHLGVKPIRRGWPRRASQLAHAEAIGNLEIIEVVLDTYALLSPETIGLDPDDRRTLLEVLETDPLALIEYWAVDPDYDGTVFRPAWQDYRGNPAHGRDPLHVTATARMTTPYKRGERRVCVRVTDVFGTETDVVQVLAALRIPQR